MVAKHRGMENSANFESDINAISSQWLQSDRYRNGRFSHFSYCFDIWIHSSIFLGDIGHIKLFQTADCMDGKLEVTNLHCVL